jgi:hypothetical protein
VAFIFINSKIKIMSKNPPKWTNVYPAGTQEGNEESKFFCAIARNPKYEWLSTSAIAQKSGLSKQRVEQIISKYYEMKMIYQNPVNNEQWGYWERVSEMIVQPYSPATNDKKNRINEVLKKKPH